MIYEGHWICDKCGSETYHLRTVVEAHGEEHLNTICPFCHGTYKEAVKCSLCGKYIAESESLYDGEYYCTECKVTCACCGEIVDKDNAKECEGYYICFECEKEADKAIEDLFGKEKERCDIPANDRPQIVVEGVFLQGVRAYKEGA